MAGKPKPMSLSYSPFVGQFSTISNIANSFDASFMIFFDTKLCLHGNEGKMGWSVGYIRPNALGRKNYLFARSHEGAKRAAMFYSVFGTCKKTLLIRING